MRGGLAGGTPHERERKMTYDPADSDNIRAMLRRATVEEVDDSGSQQLVNMRGLKGERFTKVYRAQPHGFSSVPPEGSEAVLLALGGRSDRVIMIGAEHRDHRPRNLPGGAQALYGINGELISLIGGVVRIVGATLMVEADTKVVLKAPRVDLGEEGGDKVVTEAGPSSKVYAVV